MLYDNLISHIRNLDSLTHLTSLDLGHNVLSEEMAARLQDLEVVGAALAQARWARLRMLVATQQVTVTADPEMVVTLGNAAARVLAGLEGEQAVHP